MTRVKAEKYEIRIDSLEEKKKTLACQPKQEAFLFSLSRLQIQETAATHDLSRE